MKKLAKPIGVFTTELGKGEGTSIKPSALASGLFLLAAFSVWLSGSQTCGQSSDSPLTTVDKSNLDLAALHVAKWIQEANLAEGNPSVLVIDFFRGSPGTSSALGTLLADRFSASLGNFSKNFTVVDREVLKEYFKREWTTSEDLQGREACLYLGREMGATGVVVGSIELENNLIAMRIHLEGFGPPKRGEDIFQQFDEVGRIAATEEVKALLFQKGPNYFHAPQDIPEEPGVLRGGTDGAGLPTCVRCPDPGYTPGSRSAKFQGSVKLSVVVTENGKAASIYVLKGAPFGLTTQAIETVRGWEFKPGQKDGKPVAVRIPVEFTFRLF